MKREIFQTIDIPEGVNVTIDGGMFNVEGPEGKNWRKFNIRNLEFNKKGNQIIIGSKKATKKEKKRINTTKAHVENLIKGVQEKFEYQLKICYSHFPMNVEVKEGEVVVKNFFGGKIDRKTKVIEGIEIEINKEMITVKSTNKELAGQMAADLERITKIRKKDRRVFQDGIFIVNKSGKEM